jgi:hypothetical protein
MGRVFGTTGVRGTPPQYFAAGTPRLSRAFCTTAGTAVAPTPPRPECTLRLVTVPKSVEGPGMPRQTAVNGCPKAQPVVGTKNLRNRRDGRALPAIARDDRIVLPCPLVAGIRFLLRKGTHQWPQQGRSVRSGRRSNRREGVLPSCGGCGGNWPKPDACSGIPEGDSIC